MTETDVSGNPTAVPSKPPFISNYGLALTVYILYVMGFFTGLSALIGVIIASLQDETADKVCQTHFQFQIRTFWIGLLYIFVGALTLHIGLGAIVLLWWALWTLIRCTKGMLALNAGRPIRDPLSWLFG